MYDCTPGKIDGLVGPPERISADHDDASIGRGTVECLLGGG